MEQNKPIQLSILDKDFIFSDLEKVVVYAESNSYNMAEVLPMFVKPLKQKAPLLQVVTPVGYPYGHQAIEAKLSETVLALVDGADEVEWILNIQAIRSGDYQYLAKEVANFLPLVAKLGRRAGLGLDVSALSTQELSAVCNVTGLSAFYAFHIFDEPNNRLSQKLAQVRVLMPDAIKIKADIVNIGEQAETEHADIISLCINLNNLREMVSEGN